MGTQRRIREELKGTGFSSEEIEDIFDSVEYLHTAAGDDLSDAIYPILDSTNEFFESNQERLEQAVSELEAVEDRISIAISTLRAKLA